MRIESMLNSTRAKSMAIGLMFLVLMTQALAGGVNKSVNVPAGSETDSQSSVNGSITVGSKATVKGSLETVNGAIRIDDEANVGSVGTVNGSIKIGSQVHTGDIRGVNGSIRLGDQAVVDGQISVVNGKISVDSGSRIDGDVSNVNGELQIIGSEIGGDLSTVNGDVLLTDNSVLKGDLVIKKPSGWSWKNQREPRIVIGAGSRVAGTIRLERKVELYIHETASVGGVSGEMTMDDAVRFSGDHP
jgi:hypothetical protein